MEGKLPTVNGGQPLPFVGILDVCAADWRHSHFGPAAEDEATILSMFWEQFLSCKLSRPRLSGRVNI